VPVVKKTSKSVRLSPGESSQTMEGGHTWQRAAAVADGNCFYDAFLYATDESHRGKSMAERAAAAAAFRENVRANRTLILDRLSDAFAVAGEAARVTDAASLRGMFEDETRDTEYTSIQLAMAIARWKGYRLVVIDGDQFAASSSVVVPAGTSDIPETGVPTATLSYIGGYRHFEPVSVDGRFVVPGEEYPDGLRLLLQKTQVFDIDAPGPAPAPAEPVAPAPVPPVAPAPAEPTESIGARLKRAMLGTPTPKEVTEESLSPGLFEGENPMYAEEEAVAVPSVVDVNVRESLGTYVSPRLNRLKKTLRRKLPKDEPAAPLEEELTPEQEAALAEIAEEVKATTSPGGLQPVDLMTKERAEALVASAFRSLPADVTDRNLGKLYRKFSRGLAERGITELSPQQFTALPITLKTMFRVNDSGNYELVDTATYAQRVEAEFQRRATATVPTGLGAPLPESTVPGAAVGNPMLVAAEAAAAEAPVRPSLPPLVSDPRARAGTVRATGARRLRKKTFKSRRGKKTNGRGTRRRQDRANRSHPNSRRGA
jgi:hypothetical protein